MLSLPFEGFIADMNVFYSQANAMVTLESASIVAEIGACSPETDASTYRAIQTDTADPVPTMEPVCLCAIW